MMFGREPQLLFCPRPSPVVPALATFNRRSFLLLCTCALFTALSGCTTVRFVQLREKPPNPILDRLTTKTLRGPEPSVRSRRFFTASGYTGGDDFARMLRHCGRHSGGPHHREALYTNAELSYLAAKASSRHDRALAMELFLDAARDSWRYTVLPDGGGRLQNPNAKSHRPATEIYNGSVQGLLRLVKSSGDYRLGRPVRMPLTGRRLNLTIPHPTEWLTTDQLGEFAFVSDYELKNLTNRHTTSGVGVPIMVRRRRQEKRSPLEHYYSDRLTLPVTVVARFASEQSDTENDSTVNLELLDPRETDGLSVGDTLLPLESDLSTPLAWFLTNPKNSLLETFAFFRPDKAQKLEGLHMVQPFDPDRIPVLMVHGIWSSPLTWMEMYNDLQADPVLRDKYQFWFYMYPTGEPLTFAAANLRDRLKQVRLKCDSHGRNEKLDQMVVVGHSMGGLMAYLLTVDSEDRLWNSVSNLPLDRIRGNEDTYSEMRRVFFFESDRSVDRIVTIASPFQGSRYSNVFTRWLSRSLVFLPSQTSRLTDMILKQNDQSLLDRIVAPRTSVDSLDRDSAVLRLVQDTSVPPAVRHHNVVGISKGKSIADYTDGVVTLKSAQREDADSEVRVKASHSHVQRHPSTIAEVRRVLLEHLNALQKQKYPVTPVRGDSQARTAKRPTATAL